MKTRIADTFGEKIGMSRRDIRRLARELTESDIDVLARENPGIFSMIANKEFLWPAPGWSEGYPQSDPKTRFDMLCSDIFYRLVRNIIPPRPTDADETTKWGKAETYIRKVVLTRMEAAKAAHCLDKYLNGFVNYTLPAIWPGADARARNGKLRNLADRLPEELYRIARNALLAGTPEWHNRIIFYKGVHLQPMDRGEDPPIHFIRLKERLEFKNRADLQGYFDALAAGLKKRAVRHQEPVRPILEQITRSGSPQNLSGLDVEAFRKRFAFRGGEFGSWIRQSDRQQSLDWAASAFADLASLLGIEEKAIGRGSLGIAFGARGYGGFYPAAAHYEKFFTVINLTKWNGAGCVAHEWAHFMDFTVLEPEKTGSRTLTWLKGYVPATGAELVALRRKALKECEDQIVANANIVDSHNAEKIKACFADFGDWASYKDFITDMANLHLPTRIANKYLLLINRQLDLTPLYQDNNFYANAKALDRRRWRPYWSTEHELFARVFEKYVATLMARNGAHNDYLVSLYEDSSINPYPDEGDMEYFIPKLQELIRAYSPL